LIFIIDADDATDDEGNGCCIVYEEVIAVVVEVFQPLKFVEMAYTFVAVAVAERIRNKNFN
jgi:hypothetical protein